MGTEGEAKRGDKRRFASEVSRRARGDAAGRGEKSVPKPNFAGR